MSSDSPRWQTLIEAHVDVKTTDGYVVRMCLSRPAGRMDGSFLEGKQRGATAGGQKAIKRSLNLGEQKVFGGGKNMFSELTQFFGSGVLEVAFVDTFLAR